MQTQESGTLYPTDTSRMRPITVAKPEVLNAMPLEIEFQIRKRFGGWQDAHHAIGVTIETNQLSILTSIKVKTGQQLLLRIGHNGLALLAVPATINAVEQRGADFVYHIQFDMSKTEKDSLTTANRILRILRSELKPVRS